MEDKVITLKKTARFAGLLYLIWVITGIYGMMYVPSQTIVTGNAVATANKILSNEFIFRTGIINDLFSAVICVFMLLALYKLFKNVNEAKAKLMVALFFVTIPVMFIMDGFNIASLMILKGEILKTYELSQRQDFAMLLFKINDYATLTLEMFWGLWLIPLAQMVYKSGFIPRIIGILLMINGIAYMVDSFIFILLPNYHALINQFIFVFIIPGEISIMLWLLIKGVKNNISIIEEQ